MMARPGVPPSVSTCPAGKRLTFFKFPTETKETASDELAEAGRWEASNGTPIGMGATPESIPCFRRHSRSSAPRSSCVTTSPTIIRRSASFCQSGLSVDQSRIDWSADVGTTVGGVGITSLQEIISIAPVFVQQLSRVPRSPVTSSPRFPAVHRTCRPWLA